MGSTKLLYRLRLGGGDYVVKAAASRRTPKRIAAPCGEERRLLGSEGDRPETFGSGTEKHQGLQPISIGMRDGEEQLCVHVDECGEEMVKGWACLG